MSVTPHLRIAPSMMCADFLHLEEELRTFEREGIDYLHMDVMDGQYVPNFTLGPDFCRVVSQACSIPLDVHLMVEEPDRFIPLFAQFPGAVVTIHPETSRHPIRTLQMIRSFGAKAGIAVDPAMPVNGLEYLLPDCDLVCVMTVNPGYAGQKLVPQTMPKISALRDYIAQRDYNIEIEVDGNVSWENIPKMREAGATVYVAGTSSVFTKDMARPEAIRRMKALLGRSI